MQSNPLAGLVPVDPVSPAEKESQGVAATYQNASGVLPANPLNGMSQYKPSVLTDQMNQVKQRQQQDFVGTLQAVSKVNPDQFAKATQVERWSGVPADVLHKHQEKADALLASRKYENIYADYAKTAKALADGKIAALAHDDIDNITRIEDAVNKAKFNQQSWGDRNLFNPSEKWWQSRAQSSHGSQAAGLQDQLAIFDEIDRAATAGEIPLGTVEQRQNAGAKGLIYLNATPEDRQLMRADLLKLQEGYSAKIAEREKAIQSFIPDPSSVRAQRLGGGAAGTWDAITEEPSYLWRLGVESVPNMLESLAAGAVAGPAGAGVASFNMEKGAKRLDVLREAGVDLTNPRAFLQALQDDELMAQADHRSSMKGAGVGLLDVISAGFAGKLLMPATVGGKAISQTNRELANLAIQFPVQGAGEAAGEATGQLLADGKVDGGDVLIEGLIGGGMSTLDVMTYGGDRVVASVKDGLRKSRNAKVGKAALDQMVEAVEGGKLKGRDLESFKSVTEQQLKGSDIETVWVPAAKLQELNQSGIAILPELLKQVPGLGEQFAEASARGGSVQLKTSDYLAHFGGFHDQLGDYVRLQADGLSVDEIKGWEDEQVAQLEMMAQSMKEAADPKSVVYQDAMGQLIAAGWQQQDAAQVASLRTAMITKLSKSTGLSVDELMARDPLNIRKQAPEQLQRIPVTEMGLMLDRLRTGDVPKPADMFGKSLMEQLSADGGLQDDGGELAALDANVGKVGRNRITRPDGKTLDHAAMWAWERGYFPGVDQKDVGPDLIVNALREEMAGKPRYSVAQENATLRDQADALNALQDHLDQLGVDLSQLDNAQVAELLSKPQGEQAYSQDGTLKTDTTAFKRWFGDSQVVDADGKPLVVYHVTSAEFDTFNDERPIFVAFDERGASVAASGSGKTMSLYVRAERPVNTIDSPVHFLDVSKTLRSNPDADSVYVSDEAGVSLALRSNKQIKSAIGNNGNYDPNDASILHQPDGGMGSPDDNRGSITFGPRQDGVREFNINLGPKSDLSTVLHELGHYYLEVIGGLVDDGKANAELAGDYAAIRKWLGAADGEPLHVDQHEQFARGFEKYLAEGKAPSIELQGAFARFKRWMVAIYKDLARLNVELTDEVRSVFDRLLASQEEIDAAMQVSQAMPMFEDATKAGMTEAEWSAYQSYLTAMRDDAETDIERQIRAEETRRQSKWWNEQLNTIRKEVGEEVDLVPVYKAMKALRTGQLEGVAATFKLQSGEINERYGKRVLQRLAFMHSKQGGVPMDIAASMVGFQSGDEMVKAILESPSRAAAIEQEAQQRMQERHGNKVTGEAADKAMAAVHNERRADVLRIELEALGRNAGKRSVTPQNILKEAAKRIMQQRKVREIAPHEYQRAEAKAGREAFAAVANGDLEAAYEAKQRQLLNFHLYREAVKAREQVAKITERMKGYNKTSRRQKIGKAGHDYLDQIDAVMEQYEFRNVSLRELDKRVSFGQWYNDQVAAGNDPYVPEFILKSMGKTNYKDLSLDQLQELDEFTKHVEHLARFKNKLLANDRIATKEEATNMLVDGAYANMEQLGRELIDKNARDVSEETRDYLREGNSSLMKVEQVIDWLDGGKTDGNWTQVFWRPLAEAQHKRDDLNRAVTQKVNAAIKEWFDTLGKDAGAKIHITGTNQPMTRNGVLAVALNQGNAGNKAKLLKGYGWDQSVVDEILGHMTKADWQLVNNLWEIVGSLWPEIAAMEKQANGIAPAAVEHTPVETPFGVLSGGYWPLVYDTMSDAYANVLKDMGTLAPLSEQGQVRAATPRGHTKARVDGFAAPIVLDVSIIGHHLAGVVHDLTHRLPLADARSLLTTPSVVSALNKTIGKPMTAQFRNMVDGIAADLAPGSQKGIGVIQRGMNILRSNQAVAWMGYSVTTAINQIGGYGQGMEYFAQKGARKHYLKALAKFAANPIAQMEMARTMSGEMRNRDINLDQTLREATGQMIQVKDGHLIMDAWKGVKAGRDALVKYSFVPLRYVQRMVDVPVWMAAYELEGGALNHDIAVQAADKAVRLTQMAGGAKDLSSVQHSDLLRFFLPVYGYASLLWNRNVDIARVAKQGIKQRNAKQVLLAFERFIYLNILPAMLAAAIKGYLPDEEDDETWAAWVAVNSLLSVTNGVPLMRDIAAGAFSDFGYGGASQIGAGFGNLLKATNASSAESITTNMVSAAGQLFGLPASQINRSVRTAFALEDGEMEESADAIIRGILFGPPRD